LTSRQWDGINVQTITICNVVVDVYTDIVDNKSDDRQCETITTNENALGGRKYARPSEISF